jgi:hypothetical protein
MEKGYPHQKKSSQSKVTGLSGLFQLHFPEKCIKKTNRKHGPRRLNAVSIPTLSLIRKQRVDLTSCRKIISCLIHCSWIKFPSGHGKSNKLAHGLLSTWWIDCIKAKEYKQWWTQISEHGSVDTAWWGILVICKTSEWPTASSPDLIRATISLEPVG